LTGDDYIGSSVNISKRWIKHRYLLRLQKHFNQFLQNSWNKYGLDAFKFVVLEITTNLREREMFWINQCTPTLNGTTVIERPDPDGLGICISETTRKKLSDSHKGHIPANKGLPGRKHTEEEKAHLSKLFRGRKFSSETCQKISIAKTGKHRKDIPWNKGQRMSEETKLKVSISKTGQRHPQTIETRQKIAKGHFGIPLSEEHRRHTSEGLQRYWQKRKSEDVAITN
jgi:group I intron endonuclease